jgi:hypothetical protein
MGLQGALDTHVDLRLQQSGDPNASMALRESADAIAWSAAGAVLARMPGFDSDLPFPILFAMLGFVSGVLFTGLIAMIEKGRSYDRIPLARFAAWGGAGG